MKTARILSTGLVLAVLAFGRPASGDGWSWNRLNPFASADPPKVQKEEPSTLEKFNEGTKRFFAKTTETLTGKKPAKKTTYRSVPWIRPTPQRSEPEKPSWFGSLFRRKEPKPVESMDDWWALKRMDP